MKSLKKIGFWLTLLASILILSLPLLIAILTSFKTEQAITSFPPKWFFTPTFEHYLNVFYRSGFPFDRFFLNSFIISTGSSILVILLCIPAAYGMVRMKVGLKHFFPFVVGLRLLPPIVFAIPYYMMFQYLHLLDTQVGLIWIGVLMSIPLTLMLLVGFIQELSEEIEEAAMIDGCSTYRILGSIVFPLIAPGAAAAAILSFIFTWNEFLFVRILSNVNATTVTVGSTLFIQAYGIRWGDVAAAIILSVIPPLIFTLFVQRYLVNGLSMGAVKG
jgi:multiple sugar transport system permease protein